jgi:uncharacterized protein YyaL (SSP411 family)
MPNRLAAAQSPYLRQHQDNPVDWYPWGEEALSRARSLNRPILLSIGYSACHWCHVMAHESFEDQATADLMNRDFVSIKVDREERPDLDDVYQQAIQLLGRQGGWPLTVFLTPEGVPFYGGTYFPREGRYGLPAFARILEGVAEAFRERRAEVERSGQELLHVLAGLTEPRQSDAGSGSFPQAVNRLLQRVDFDQGGFGSAPKFPHTMVLEALMRAVRDSGAQASAARTVVLQALSAMADGGIHDQLGGGFHRYSTDAAWRVPHFEKMLYDNALLAPLYLSAFQLTGEQRFADVARGIFEFLDGELCIGGAFASSLDADSDGTEGRFYVWTRTELLEVLGPALGERMCQQLGVGETGNFEEVPGASVLTRPRTAPGEAEDSEEVREGKRRLLAARAKRTRPFRDDKIIAGWNALAVSALARGSAVLDDAILLGRARRAMEALRAQLRDEAGNWMRSALDGPSGIPAFSEDYAALAVAHLDLFDAAWDPEDLQQARELATILLDRFYLPQLGAMTLVSETAEPLVFRPLSVFDNAIPGATGLGLTAFQRLAALTGDARFERAAKEIVERQSTGVTENPFGFGQLLCGIHDQGLAPLELVIVGDRHLPHTRALLQQARRVFEPTLLTVVYPSGYPLPDLAKSLVEGREHQPEPTAFLCRGASCLPPITDPAKLYEALRAP